MNNNAWFKKEKPLLSLQSMGGGASGTLMQGAVTPGTYVDETFKSYTYNGNGSSQTITTDIATSTDGALVWLKMTDASGDYHHLYDTVRGAGKTIFSNYTGTQQTSDSDRLSAFTSTGFSLGSNYRVNQNGSRFQSFTFKKEEKFFDIVSYTGNATGQSISHNLGCVPAAIFIKRLDGSASSWAVYHKDIGNTKYLKWDDGDDANTSSYWWEDTSPTSTTFRVGQTDDNNANSNNYIAYLFASEEAAFGFDGAQVISKVGSYTGSGSSGKEITLGWRPQYVMIKRTSGGNGDWVFVDHIGGVNTSTDAQNINDNLLYANNSDAYNNQERIEFTSTGFTLKSTAGNVNSNVDYIYIAIREADGYVGKPITDATKVFTPTVGSSGAPMYKSSNHYVDIALQKSNYNTSSNDWQIVNRSSNNYYMKPNKTVALTYNLYQDGWQFQDGWSAYPSGSGIRMSWLFRQYPQGLQYVFYRGDGTAGNVVTHQLNATPEMTWIKRRDGVSDWSVWHKGLNGGSSSLNYEIFMNYANAENSSGNFSAMGSESFTLGASTSTNGSGDDYVAYLFASVSGISKVGTYSVSDATEDKVVDVGFAPRLVIIKRRNAGSTNWIVSDSHRGSSDGNTPLLFLNSDATQAYETQMYYSGNTFVIKSATAGGQLLDNGGEYIYYAHA